MSEETPSPEGPAAAVEVDVGVVATDGGAVVAPDDEDRPSSSSRRLYARDMNREGYKYKDFACEL